MAKEGPPVTQNRISSRKGYSMIHPDVETQRTTPVSYREAKESSKWFPWLIPAFVVANVVMFAVTMYVNDCPKHSVKCVAAEGLRRFSFQPFKENLLLGPSSTTLQKMGGLDVKKVVHEHQGWRLISCIWLHAGVFHILANMLSLLVIGIQLEREFGFVLIGLVYIIAGLGGSLLSALFIHANISVGASGALFGLLGSMLSELITNWSLYANKFAAFFTLIVIIAINLAVGILPHVDNFAHIGGFLSGFLLGFVFLIRPQHGWVRQRYASASATVKSKYKAYQIVLWVFSLIGLITGFTVGLVLLFRGFNAGDHCSWCHYLSCFPTSHWSCNNEPASCLITQTGNQLNITCSSNGKSGIYLLPSLTDSHIQGLCSELCN